ncbi:MAG: RraA family protein, partial [Lentisphaerae bacterium]|nr:RraA family protein [Lentisphaerota bacterium]
MRFDCKDDIIQLTPEWKGERFPNGRPRVPDAVLKRLRNITFEEAWAPLWSKGYKYQWECDFKLVHPDTKLVGRAVTAVMVPMRPDLHKTLLDHGHQVENRHGFFNQWVIDQLTEDDVVVVDLFDKIVQGTYVGGNLSTAIATRTKRGGAVIWGGIHDLEQIVKIKETQTFYRGVDPTGIGDVTMTGMNVPCRIGKAICMPGDVVLGTISGVIFIPPQFAEEVATQAEKSHVRDIFGFIRLAEKVYSTAQIDTAWTLHMWQDFVDWF